MTRGSTLPWAVGLSSTFRQQDDGDEVEAVQETDVGLLAPGGGGGRVWPRLQQEEPL